MIPFGQFFRKFLSLPAADRPFWGMIATRTKKQAKVG